MDDGHCEGMAVLALLFELDKAEPTDFGGATAFEISLVGNNVKLQHEIALWWSTQALEPMSQAEIRTLTPIEIVDKLTRRSRRATRATRSASTCPTGSGGHATTPYAIVDKSDAETWIMHYDNNFPGEERHIDVDATANTWKYFTAANPKEPGAAYDGDANTKTLTIAPTSVRLRPRFRARSAATSIPRQTRPPARPAASREIMTRGRRPIC